jgi:hypothetical protein
VVTTQAARVYQQIEDAADFYEPELYARLGAFNVTPLHDLDASDFIPLTGATVLPKSETKMFVIGLLPPSVKLTMRLLDRSATIQSRYGSGQVIDVETREFKAAPSKAALPPVGTTPRTGPKGPANTVYATRGLENTTPEFRRSLEEMAIRLEGDATAIAAVMSLETIGTYDPAIRNKLSGATGLIQFMPGKSGSAVRLGTTTDDLAKMTAEEQLVYVERYLEPFKGRYKRPIDAYLAVFAPSGVGKSDDFVLYSGGKAVSQNKGFDLDKNGVITVGEVARVFNPMYESAVARGPYPDPVNIEAPVNESWVESGSPNAQKAAVCAENQDGTDLPPSVALAQSLETAQKATIQALADALRQMAETPPLRMLVNPESFKVSEEKVIADGNWTRTGPVVEHWGENQPTISASGRVAGFYALDVNAAGVGSPGNSPGLTRAARNFSTAYQNLLSLYFIYKNNGAVFIPDDLCEGARQTIAMLGSVYIYYDNILYIGSFSSLNLQESDDKPFSLQYDFEFSVRASWLLDRQVDPRATYGNKAIFAKDLDTISVADVLASPVSADETKVAPPPAPPRSPEQEAEDRYNREILDPVVGGPASMDSEETKQQWIFNYTQEALGVEAAASPVVEPQTPSPDWGKTFSTRRSNPVDPAVSAVIAPKRNRAQYERSVLSTQIPYVRTKK